jgi:putative transposase
LSKEFASFLRQTEVAHVRTSVNYPQSNGKIERYHRTLSEECLRKTSLIDLEDARTQIGDFVEKYNRERKHSALHYRTTEVFLEGRVEANLSSAKNASNKLRKSGEIHEIRRLISPY